MRHMGANFYDHFKNKNLMVLLKRLCFQNQQRKFNALWKLLDDMTAKHIEEREARASSSNTTQAAQSSASTVKPFTQWIRDALKEKWLLLYDTDGSCYSIMTSNQAESYNMVMRGILCLPLVGIVEFIMYGCAKYFRDHYNVVSPSLNNPEMLFGYRITEYMDKKITKTQQHNVDRWVQGNKYSRLHVRTDLAMVCAGRGWCRNACLERTARLLARAISQSYCIYHACMSLPHVWSPGFSEDRLFLLISQKR